jgi:ribose transport system substrate-binding protein
VLASPRTPILINPRYINMRTSKLIRFGIKTSLCLAFCAGLAVPVFAQKKLNVVAVTVGDLGNPFFVQIAHGAQAAAKKINPSVKFQSESSGYDVNNQTNQMDNFIASGANLILLNAADSKGIAPAVLRAKAAGVTVVAVDVGAEGGVDATVTSNNKQAGQLDGKYVADRLKGKGQIVIVNGPPVSAVTDRVAGFLEEIKKSPGIKILSQDQNAGGSRDGGLRVMTDLLTAFPKIDAVFAINDPSAIGCDLAAKQAQRKDFFIVGVDGAPDVVPSLKDKDSLIVASAAQDPYTMSGKAVEIGYDCMNGKKPAEELTLIPVDLITKENVDQYKGWTK